MMCVAFDERLAARYNPAVPGGRRPAELRRPRQGQLGLETIWQSRETLNARRGAMLHEVEIPAMPLKIVLTHTPQSRRQYYGAQALRELQALGEVLLHEGSDAFDAPGLVSAARDADVIVADRLTAGPSDVFTGLPKLRAFVRCAVDIRNIDVEAASAAGVLVTRASPGFVQSVAELALGFMVDLSRGISRATADYHSGRSPEIVMGRQLSGSSVGIIGYGSIGRYLARVAQSLGMTVLVADPFARVENPDLQHVPLDELLRRADYVVCLVVANEDTENLIGAAQLRLMQPHAVFINLSRGELVDEVALAAALLEKRIAGAAMDVGRARDQMPSAALAGLSNVIATPHIGGLTPPAIEAQALETVRQVGEIIKGEAPQGAVNAEKWSRR
jgi:D-3-phosphoglycerate dehydrogenase